MAGPSAVVLLRHAERKANGLDPGLTAQGRKRAELLAYMLQDVPVAAVFTSEATRTKETAAPLAARIGAEPVALEGFDAAAHRDRVLASGEGVAVVVGHTNTIPPLVEALGAEPVEIAEQEFDRLLVVARGEDGAVRLLPLRYRPG